MQEWEEVLQKNTNIAKKCIVIRVCGVSCTLQFFHQSGFPGILNFFFKAYLTGVLYLDILLRTELVPVAVFIDNIVLRMDV